MRKILLISMVFALGAGPVLAASTYCQDPVTHKRISCKTATPATTPQTHAPMASAPMASPTTTATGTHKGKKCGNSYIAQNKECHKS